MDCLQDIPICDVRFRLSHIYICVYTYIYIYISPNLKTEYIVLTKNIIHLVRFFI